jgi:anti-anti-sigma regulatory factor
VQAYVDTYRCVRPGTDIALSPEELPIVRTLGDSQLHRGELDVIAPSGQQRTLEVLSAPIFDPAGKMYSALAHFTDVTERRRAEREQLRMQQELITVQAAALAERSTPLIPIHDEIVVVPLIGSLDTERGSQLMEALLHGVGVNRARVAIIDITGVRTLDTLAASTLTSAAQALRLLGVEPVLTGIRAEVAQTLIGIGVRLDGITTRNNLQSGIAYALKLTGRPSLR